MYNRLNASLAATAIAAVMFFAQTASAVPSTPAECGYVAHFETIPEPFVMTAPTSMQAGSCNAGPLNPDIEPSLTIDDRWTARIVLPNFIDQLPLKEIWIQVMTETPPDLFDISVFGFDEAFGSASIPGVPHGVTPMQGGFIAHFWIMPNPDWEDIRITPLLDIVEPGSEEICPVEESCVILPPYSAIWIATVSRDIPEPGTLALFGLGLAGLGFARRRKAA